MTAPFLDPREASATGRGPPAIRDQNGGPGRLPKWAIPLFNRERTGGIAPFRAWFPAEETLGCNGLPENAARRDQTQEQERNRERFCPYQGDNRQKRFLTAEARQGLRKRVRRRPRRCPERRPERIRNPILSPSLRRRRRFLVAGWSGSTSAHRPPSQAWEAE